VQVGKTNAFSDGGTVHLVDGEALITDVSQLDQVTVEENHVPFAEYWLTPKVHHFPASLQGALQWAGVVCGRNLDAVALLQRVNEWVPSESHGCVGGMLTPVVSENGA
jgi:hypothetical protein